MSDEAKAVLSDKPVNTSTTGASIEGAKSTGDVKSMDYHRQLLHSKLNEDGSVTLFFLKNQILTPMCRSNQTYISPSDNIMSPCTAKLSGLKNKHFMKYVEPTSSISKALLENC